ncbi:hypothetical protein LAZ67_19002117 [Cordylochernes scorpioides]|uniref:Transposase n=1 Tax=Cordylochernes scorpioides TaxID=51811 RepID=A0ABY6LI88_9ARAC|nr:hypothetical protein LAZ67_19002117 [Cordylochernes scorpioides]
MASIFEQYEQSGGARLSHRQSSPDLIYLGFTKEDYIIREQEEVYSSMARGETHQSPPPPGAPDVPRPHREVPSDQLGLSGAPGISREPATGGRHYAAPGPLPHQGVMVVSSAAQWWLKGGCEQGHLISALAWNPEPSADNSTSFILVGTSKAYGNAVMSRRRVFEWYKRFKEGREETANNERSGRPSTSTTPEKVGKVLELVLEDRRITVREVTEEAGISFRSTQSIIKDILGVRRLNAVLVPKDFTFDQKNAWKETASLNLEATTDDPELLKRVITGDETWIYGFDSETTQQASEWRFKNEPRPKKARKAPSKVKVMLTVFFDYQGIVHHEFKQQGSTITADSYLGVLRRLREAITQKRPELWRSKSWILHHDNAPAHTALKFSKYLQDHPTSVFPQPPTVPIWPPATSSFLESSKKVNGSEI